jgi:hypothetical protein
MNITEIIPAELSGYCDIETGECVSTETRNPHGTTTENVAHTGGRQVNCVGWLLGKCNGDLTGGRSVTVSLHRGRGRRSGS